MTLDGELIIARSGATLQIDFSSTGSATAWEFRWQHPDTDALVTWKYKLKE